MVRPASLPFVKDAKPTRLDALCLVLITFLSAAPYIGRLEFYSDDWGFLAGFHFAELDGRFGLRSVLDNPSFRPRPLQGLYLAGLYKLFGLHPFGHHIVNIVVLAGSMPIFYWLLLRLRVGRASAFIATLILIVLPQLSTVRVWYSAFQIPLSMLFALGSLHFQLTYFHSRQLRWAGAALVAAALSIAAYEIFAPLLVAFALGTAWPRRSDRGADRSIRRWIPIGTLLAIAALAVIAKSLFSHRVRAPSLHLYWKGIVQLFRPDYDWRVDYGLNLIASLSVNLWHPIVGWAQAAASVAADGVGFAALSVALAGAGLAFWRLSSAEAEGGEGRERFMLALGFAAFVLGLATFLIVPDIMFSPTGMANRALVAAALGVALIFAALLQLVSRIAGAGGRSRALAILGSLIAYCGMVRAAQVAGYWADVPPLQGSILAAARDDLRDLAAGDTVILDGTCPYSGPGVVFEAAPDTSGAFSLAMGRPLQADTVSPRAALTSTGLRTSIYGYPSLYAYGPRLHVYDPRRHVVVRLDNERIARRYFRDPRRPRLACPIGYVGQGVLL